MGSQECAGKILRPFLDSLKKFLEKLSLLLGGNVNRVCVIVVLNVQIWNFHILLLLWLSKEDRDILIFFCRSIGLCSLKDLPVPTPWIVENTLRPVFTGILGSMLSNFHIKDNVYFRLFLFFISRKTNMGLYLIFAITHIWWVMPC